MTPTATPPSTAKTVELGRYVTDVRQQRILVGRRIDGVVHVYDAPLGTPGRTYFVERGGAARLLPDEPAGRATPYRGLAGAGRVIAATHASHVGSAGQSRRWRRRRGHRVRRPGCC
jgi:hypothetical protein